jgi:hypothetical protein
LVDRLRDRAGDARDGWRRPLVDLEADDVRAGVVADDVEVELAAGDCPSCPVFPMPIVEDGEPEPEAPTCPACGRRATFGPGEVAVLRIVRAYRDDR